MGTTTLIIIFLALFLCSAVASIGAADGGLASRIGV